MASSTEARRRRSKDLIAGAMADQARAVGAEPSSQKIDAYLVPVLEEADRKADEAPQSFEATPSADDDDIIAKRIAKVEAEGGRWVEKPDVGKVTLHKDGVSFTTDEALAKLAGLKGRKAEELRRRLFLKYLRLNHPLLWGEFLAAAKLDGLPHVRERRLHEVLERCKRAVPVNPWNPEPKKIVTC